MTQAFIYDTSIGKIGIAASGAFITHVFFGQTVKPKAYELSETPLLHQAYLQLEEYLTGRRTIFELPLRPEGTPFQQLVWQALLTIPYGQVRTYAQIAGQIGRPKACRAVGLANGRNPISIFIPCHRVIGANGTLTGYAGGLDMKKKLLDLEGVCLDALV